MSNVFWKGKHPLSWIQCVNRLSRRCVKNEIPTFRFLLKKASLCLIYRVCTSRDKMATSVDHAYCGWSHEELPHRDDSQEVSASQMLDHGSISFGRFAYESLSWEKRSVFTYNKCQEELDRFKSPGLVAKKKAYFEEYYKKIRAMKALQESQQTEITLDYGGDGSISSQTGEEDETAVQLEDLGGGGADIAIVQPEVPQIKVSMEKKTYCSEELEGHIGHSEPESILPDSDSFRTNFQGHEEEDKTVDPEQRKHLDTDILVHESLTICIEEPKHQYLSVPDKDDSRGNNISVTNIEPGVDSRETYCTKNSNEEDVDLKPAHSVVPRKVMPATRKYKGNVSAPKMKPSPSPSRIGLKMEQKAKPNIERTIRGPKYPVQKMNVKSGSGVCSSKSTVDKVSRNYKPTNVASNRPLKEVNSNVTIPRPFSLATDRRAAAPSGSRDTASKMISKSSTQRSSSAGGGKDAINVQVNSKRTIITSCMQSRGLENKRINEEKKKPVKLDNQCADPKLRGGYVPSQEKARSAVLHPHNKCSSNSGTDIRFKNGFNNDRHKGGRNEARVSEFHQADAKNSTPPAKKLRSDTKKTTQTPPSLTSNPSVSWLPRFGDLSLGAKKPRQEKPRWR